MGYSLGMSTGSSGVYSAFVDTDPTADAPGSVPAETRFVSADQVHANIGDLVRASIKLMTTQVKNRTVAPRSIGVTYSTDEQLSSIRSSLARSSDLVRLIPESAAVHAYLAETGKIARYNIIALVDVGARGVTVSIVDHSGKVLGTEQTDALAGAAIDRALVALVTDKASDHLGRYADTELLVSRCHGAKEQLSTERSVTVDLPLKPLTITRAEFETIIAADIECAVALVAETVAHAPQPVEAVVLIGGGARIPAVRSACADGVDLPMVTIDEPEAVAAKGAALLADSVTSLHYPLAGSENSERTGSAAKASGALIGALVVGGLVLGYGAKELTPTEDTQISPVGTDSTPAQVTTDIIPSVGSTVIPSFDPLPPVAREQTPAYRSPTTTRAYPTQKYTLPAAPLPDTSAQPTPITTVPTTTAPTTVSTTTTVPTTTVPTTTTVPASPKLPGLTLPDLPAWWPRLPGANTQQVPVVPPAPQPDLAPVG